MSTLAHSERGRVGVSLVGVGTLLLVLSMLMLWSAPGAQATHTGGGGFPTGDCGDHSAGGYKVGINDNTWVGTFDEAHGVAQADVTWSITSPDPLHTVVDPGWANPSDPEQYFNYNYHGATFNGSEFQLEGVFLKIGGGQDDASQFIATSTNPGSVLLPNGTSHVTLCFSLVTTTTTTVADTTTTTVADTTTTTVADTTTTTVADTTTTTVAGPGEPTTTTTVDDTTTTTVAGPDEPELPETGAGHFLALMAGALGLMLVGSGSLVIASDRRRQFIA